jgi:hypothetical protein
LLSPQKRDSENILHYTNLQSTNEKHDKEQWPQAVQVCMVNNIKQFFFRRPPLDRSLKFGQFSGFSEEKQNSRASWISIMIMFNAISKA